MFRSLLEDTNSYRSMLYLAALFAAAAFGLTCAGSGAVTDYGPDTTIIDADTQTFSIPDTPWRRNVEIYDHVTLLETKTLEGATESGEERLVFAPGIKRVDALERGDVIVSRAGDGLARKIQNIERTEESVQLDLTRAHLNEIIADGEFYFGPRQRVVFADGEMYVPPRQFLREGDEGDGETPNDQMTERQMRWAARSTTDAEQHAESPAAAMFSIGPRNGGSPNALTNNGNLTRLLNEALGERGIRSHVEFVHQLLEIQLATSARFSFCRGDACSGGSTHSGLARLERFALGGHGLLEAATRMRYSASELMIPDADANGVADWKQEGLPDYLELPLVSTQPEKDPLLPFAPRGVDEEIQREFEVIPGVSLQFDYDVDLKLQVDGDRPMDLETGFELAGLGGCGSEADGIAPWTTARRSGRTCGANTGWNWHTRPIFAANRPIGDSLELSVRLEPEVRASFSGGIEGEASAVFFGGEQRVRQGISAPQIGNCASRTTVESFGHRRTNLQRALLSPEEGGGAAAAFTDEDEQFRHRLADRTGRLAVPGICNPAWTPVSDPGESSSSPGQLEALESSGCPSLRRPDVSCYNTDHPDWDRDGVPRELDNSPCRFNPAQLDSDGNGEGDVSDDDADEDGIMDWTDNCPTVVNRDQKKGPLPGIGAACTPEYEQFYADSPIRIRPVSDGEERPCRFRLSRIAQGVTSGDLRGYVRMYGSPGSARDFWDTGPFPTGRDGNFLWDRFFDLSEFEDGEATLEFDRHTCEAYRKAVEQADPARRGYHVAFGLAADSIPGDEPSHAKLSLCPHDTDSIELGQDDDEWLDPRVPNPTQVYDTGADNYVGRLDSSDHSGLETDGLTGREPDTCPFHPNPVPKGEEADHLPDSYDSNGGSACRVQLDQDDQFDEEQLAAIDHSTPVFELEFAGGTSREDWNEEYPLVDYSGDGVLAHHPGYPAPCTRADIADCVDDLNCEVPRCSDNCPTIPNPHQEDRNDNGVGDRCEHADSEPVNRTDDAGELFGINNPHYIDAGGRLKIYDSDQDDIPDHQDNCPFDWNFNQVNTNAPGSSDEADNKTDRFGDACSPDIDGDGRGSVCDPDRDGDGIPNVLDFCPDAGFSAGPDGDGQLDRDTNRPCNDADGDGIQGAPEDYPPFGKPELAERWYDEGWASFNEDQRPTVAGVHGAPLLLGVDNCPTVANPGQFDLDHDGVGDACDPDMVGNSDVKSNADAGVDAPDSAFVTVWNVEQNPELSLPLIESEDYDFTVRWGDGIEESVTDPDEATHTYNDLTEFTVVITGDIEGWRMADWEDADRLLRIEQWGNFQFGDHSGHFKGAENLEITATDVPDLSATTTLREAFVGCESITEIPSMNDWDVSNITDMEGIFGGAEEFDAPIGGWDVSNVTTMRAMFSSAESFNKPIGDWDVSSVTNMEGMFGQAESFNQPIGGWDVSSVTNMRGMFAHADSFDQPLNDWDVSSVNTMEAMFRSADSFNRDINGWDVSSVRQMNGIFQYTDSFDQPVEEWSWDATPEQLGVSQ